MEDAKKAIITVLGHDRVGIIHAISGVLVNANINILDINQTIMQGYFTMIMVVDLTGSSMDFSELKELLGHKGEEMGLHVSIQHEDIFKFMHRI